MREKIKQFVNWIKYAGDNHPAELIVMMIFIALLGFFICKLITEPIP